MILWISGGKGIPFLTQEVGRYDLSLVFTKLAWCYKKWEKWCFSSQKNDKMIFFNMEYHVYGLPKSSYFELFRDEKYGIFLRQKVDGKIIFIDYWKVLVLSFSLMGNTVFFFSENVDGKMIFTWSFWAFHGIPGLGKYGFSCSVSNFT